MYGCIHEHIYSFSRKLGKESPILLSCSCYPGRPFLIDFWKLLYGNAVNSHGIIPCSQQHLRFHAAPASQNPS